MNVIEKRDKILELYDGKICDVCLGRQFTMLYKGYENGPTGAVIREAKTEQDIKDNLSNDKEYNTSDDCKCCKGVFKHLDDEDGLYKKLLKKSKAYEFNNFLIGVILPDELIEQEDQLWSKVGAENAEPLKKELNRIIGKKFYADTGKEVEFDAPEINFIIDFKSKGVDVVVNSLFIKGKYNKLVRGIPQTRWPCRECNGRGCKRCNFTGKMYQTSVEEEIAKIPIVKFEAIGEKFHGSGREDIDALMLGEGRPFVLELKKPRLRFYDLKTLEKEINDSTDKIKVSDLKPSSKKEVRQFKEAPHDKEYEAIIECEKPITEQDIKILNESFNEITLDQRTPQRVAHRRADKNRIRKVYYVKAQKIEDKKIKAIVKAAAGTYIKELISGDNGRTKPSMSEKINNACVCTELNVLHVFEQDDKL